jgi:hypothetical protein
VTPEGKRRFNTLMGSGFLVLGVTAWALTVYFGLTPAPAKPHPVSLAPTVDLNSCRSLLQRLGYSATVQKNEVTARQFELADPPGQLEQATLAIAACKLPLKTFCMGTDCDGTGLTFTLSTVADSLAPAPTHDATPPTPPKRPNVPTRAPAKAPPAPARK